MGLHWGSDTDILQAEVNKGRDQRALCLLINKIQTDSMFRHSHEDGNLYSVMLSEAETSHSNT
jgi:hypothetical protein